MGLRRLSGEHGVLDLEELLEATVGQVDETQLFYLMSRGLSRPEAEQLLVLGFFDEVLSRVPLEGTRERIREAIERKIGLSR